MNREKDEEVIKFTPHLPKKVVPFEITVGGTAMQIKVANLTREKKITFCYEIAKRIGDEVEQPFEDLFDESLDKAYVYYTKLYWASVLREGK